MQIHEITNGSNIKTPELNEGMMDSISGAWSQMMGNVPTAGPGSMASLNYGQKAQRLSQNKAAKDAADKGFSAWQVYINGIESQIADPAKKTAWDNRTDGLYEKYLMAFVRQNMLQGRSLSKLLNKDDIIDLVHKISGPLKPVPVPEASVNPRIVGRPQAVSNLKANTARAAGAATPAAPPPAGAATPAAPPPAPPPAGAAAGAAAAGATPAPPTNPAEQKTNFEKLVFAVASASKDSAADSDSVNPIQFASQLQQIGKAVIASSGSTNVKTTGNPSADNVLKLMGLTPA